MNLQENDMESKLDKKQIWEAIREYNQSQSFADRKLTDTPTDALSVVNRKYVTLNGVVADRPKSSVASIGQSYYATDINIPMTYSAGGWMDGVGSIIALNN